MYTELLVGCGNSRKKKLPIGKPDWYNLTTLDIDEWCRPDILHDLESLPYPFEDNNFDEIHAYEVLEHTGKQGDWMFFLEQFAEFWRILKPGGKFAAIVPSYKDLWAWGDPGHTRIINSGTLVFLMQSEYEKQVGVTAMTDYRQYYSADFKLLGLQEGDKSFQFVLEAIKK